MKRKIPIYVWLVVALAVSAIGFAAARNWQTGTLNEAEQSKVREGSTSHTTTDGDTKNTTKTDNYETYQTYTVDTGQKIYVAREHLLFPWSKPANVAVGAPVKYAVEKNTFYIMDDDGKEHKARVVKVSMKTAAP